MSRYTKSAAVAIVAVGLLAGCSAAPSTEPVPSKVDVDAAFICDGVPLEGARNVIGRDEVEVGAAMPATSWLTSDGEVNGSMLCSIQSRRDIRSSSARGSDPEISVSLNLGLVLLNADVAQSEAEYRSIMAANPHATAIESDAPGWGYAWGPNTEDSLYSLYGTDSYQAIWFCDGVSAQVVLQNPHAERDSLEDVASWTISMLPWLCEGQSVPPSTVLIEG